MEWSVRIIIDKILNIKYSRALAESSRSSSKTDSRFFLFFYWAGSKFLKYVYKEYLSVSKRD